MKWAPYGFTPLMMACRAPAEDEEVALALMAFILGRPGSKAEINRQSEGNEGMCSALTMAAEEGHLKRVRLLLSKDADVNITDQHGRTPLMYACQSGFADVVKVLLEHKADPMITRVNPERPDKKDGRTVLMYAGMGGSAECIKHLLNHGTNEYAKAKLRDALNAKKESALAFAARNGHTEACKLLLEAGISIDHEIEEDYWTSLHRAAANGHESTVRELLHQVQERDTAKHDKLINHKNPKGITPLIAAANSNHAVIVGLLLEKGADPARTLETGANALYEAAKLGQVASLRLLLKNHDASASEVLNKTAKEKDGVQQTALMAACRAGHADAVRALLKTANINTHIREKVDEGDDALTIAVRQGDEMLVRMLLAHADFEIKEEPKAGETYPELLERLEKVKVIATVETSPQTARAERVESDPTGRLRRRGSKTLSPSESIIKQLQSKLDQLTERHMKRNTTLVNGDSFHGKRSFGPSIADEIENDERLTEEKIEEMVGQLKFAKQYSGQLVPPRPTRSELENNATATGRLHEYNGVVHQRGPFNGIYLRAGCVFHVTQNKIWHTLRRYVEHHLKVQGEKVRKLEAMTAAERVKADKPCGVYVVVSQWCTQGIDFTWLAKHGFQFHHYREPAADLLTSGNGSNGGEGGGVRSDMTAEFVYYCWPTHEKDPYHPHSGTGGVEDKVAAWASSIEGATGVLLSPDETKVLLVWERGSWNTPGGAVNKGECKYQALIRECGEELGVEVDLTFDAVYLGGWQQGRARDNEINDNFTVLCMRLKTEDFFVDGIEIARAGFIEFKPLLAAWRAENKPKKFAWAAPDGRAKTPNGTEEISNKLLGWLDTYESGRGLKCRVTTQDQAGIDASKIVFG